MALALSLLANPLERDEPYLYHDISLPGFFSLLTELPGEGRRQTSYKLQQLPQVLPGGHFKIPHLWPVKLLQAGRWDYESLEVSRAMREAASLSR
jgi:hypothetical protein